MSSYINLVFYTIKLTAFFIFFLILLSFSLQTPDLETSYDLYSPGSIFTLIFAGLLSLGMLCPWRAGWQSGLNKWITSSSDELKTWIEKSTPSTLCATLVFVSGLTLFFELVLIRWESGFFPIFAMYKNFTLLACFCGLGLGYAMANQPRLLLSLCLPVLGFLLLALSLLYYNVGGVSASLLHVVPVREETTVFFFAFDQNTDLAEFFLYSLPAIILLAIVFILNALVLLPTGQLCGYLMQRMPALSGYSYNLLGSIAGVALLFVLSYFWTTPVIWFGMIIAIVMYYQVVASPTARKVALLSAMTGLMIISWPFEPLVQNIYSPYQLIQASTQPNGMLMILASGNYYQKIFDLGFNNANRETDPSLNAIAGYYEFPFVTASSLNRVAIVGAGTGNDVAAALRYRSSSVDAVEIDPAIFSLGREHHPERPYSNPAVHPVINDARNFFRDVSEPYDLIVYGVLDSHIVASYGANVRIDSFVYTQEGLREAYSHLKPGGLMSVSFALPNALTGKKIFRILKEMPGAGPPAAILTGYDSIYTTSFLVRKGEKINLPLKFMAAHQLKNVTFTYEADAGEKLDIPTDDWPFFYMSTKTYPGTYVVSLAMALVLTFMLTRLLLPGQAWRFSLLPFFFLGSGFMLIETKAITELGLLFGNTWQVIGITIISVLVMAYLANKLVGKRSAPPVAIAFVGLLAVIALGFAVATHAGILTSSWPAKLGMVFLLASPIFFSGLIFSALLEETKDVSGAMAYNLIGAMTGGALEYNSMQFGFSSLYIIAFALYGLAWITTRRGA